MDRTELRFRNRVSWIQFILCVLVVLVHAYNIDNFQLTAEGNLATWLERFLSEELGQIAVPGFFMVSAFLFYRNFNWNQLARKWGSRVRTLLIPYLFWNLFYYVAYLIMTHIPAIQARLERPPAALSVGEFWRAAFSYQYNSVFWFLYQLILLVLLAPAIYVLLRNKLSGFATLGVVFTLLMLRIDLPLLNMDALMYYLIGSILALHWEDVVRKQQSRAMAVPALLWLFLSFGIHLLSEKMQSVQLLLIYRMTFPPGIWFLLASLPLPRAGGWMKRTFIVYAIHFLIIRALNKLAGPVLPGSSVGAILCYLLGPVLSFAAAEAADRVMGRLLPRAWAFMGGNRGR